MRALSLLHSESEPKNTDLYFQTDRQTDRYLITYFNCFLSISLTFSHADYDYELKYTDRYIHTLHRPQPHESQSLIFSSYSVVWMIVLLTV
jgi:hypothetical protein